MKRSLNTILFFVGLVGALPLLGAVHPMTMRQAVETALKQNTELVLARLDEQRARAGIQVAKDPFTPKVYGGSGLAYTSGYPNSIEGSAPSIFQIRTDMALFNRPKSFELAQARENARGAGIDTANKADDVAFRTASLFLDAQQFERSLQSLQQEMQALDSVRDAVRLRLNEGRELPLAARRAELDAARVRQRQEAVSAEAQYSEESLAVVLGFNPGDRIQPVDDEGSKTIVPDNEEACIQSALDYNKDVRRLQSQMTAKRLEMQAQKAARYPQFDLVAQYALFAKYNYQDYFQKFSRNNEQLGVAIRIPILVGSGPAGLAAQAAIDLQKLGAQMNDVRSRTVLDTRKGYHDVKRAESAREFSKLDLDVAREQVHVLLDQLDEGRATRQAVDEARMMEQEKWIAYYDGQHLLEKAKLNLLRHTGTIQAALR